MVDVLRRHLWIEGRVQGVAFRAYAAHVADGLDVGGWVRNLPDGRVEAVAEGPSPAVVDFERWCAEGPPCARVRAVAAITEAPEGLAEFRVRS